MMITSFVPWKAAALSVSTAGVMLLAAGCTSSTSPSAGSSGSSAPSSTAAAASGSQASSAVCADVAAVHASVSKLTDVKLSTATVSVLTSDADNLAAKLTSLANVASGPLSTPVTVLKSDLTALQAKLKAVGGGTGSVTSAVSALGNVLEAGDNIVSAAAASCPSASPTPSS